MEENRIEEKCSLQQTSVLQDVLHLLGKIAIIFLVIGMLFTLIFGIYRTSDFTMRPAIQDGDLVIYYRLDKNYIASDVLMLKYEGEMQTRRVVAVAGDTVDITDEGLMINGALMENAEDLLLYEDGPDFPITVSEGQVFVLGDTRRDTIDSRMYGAVDIKNTLGKVIAIIRTRNI